MINAIAIDDEQNALGIITEFSNKISDVNLVKTFTDPIIALDYIFNHQIDLIFLDIQMSKLNGLDLAKRISNKNLQIILTTAYTNFGLEAFDLDIIDYLVKPIPFERFERSINKAKLIIHNLIQLPIQEKLEILPEIDDFLFIKSSYSTFKLKISDIIFIEGMRNYIAIHTTKNKYTILENLKKIESQLNIYKFLRIHKSYIVSLKHINKIEKETVHILKNKLPIGETYKLKLKETIKNYK